MVRKRRDRRCEPGEREPSPRRSGGCMPVALGCLTVLAGIPMLVCPGPGMATIAAGLAMIAVGLGLRKPKES